VDFGTQQYPWSNLRDDGSDSARPMAPRRLARGGVPRPRLSRAGVIECRKRHRGRRLSLCTRRVSRTRVAPSADGHYTARHRRGRVAAYLHPPRLWRVRRGPRVPEPRYGAPSICGFTRQERADVDPGAMDRLLG
jgi:hypothetical protein